MARYSILVQDSENVEEVIETEADSTAEATTWWELRRDPTDERAFKVKKSAAKKSDDE